MENQRTKVTPLGWFSIALGILIILFGSAFRLSLLFIIVGVGFFLLGALSSKLRM